MIASSLSPVLFIFILRHSIINVMLIVKKES